MKTICKVDPLLKVEKFSDLLRMPITISVTKFDDEALEDFIKDIDEAHVTGQPVIPIIINSFGGCAYTCLGMLSAIENSNLPVATITTTKAMSAGAVLLAWGSPGYRFMDPNASLMLHDIADELDDKLEDLKNEIKQLDHLNDNIYKRMARRLKQKDDNYFIDLIRNSRNVDLYLSAKEAKRHKIVNHLRVPTMELSVDVKYSFS